MNMLDSVWNGIPMAWEGNNYIFFIQVICFAIFDQNFKIFTFRKSLLPLYLTRMACRVVTVNKIQLKFLD